MKFYLAASVLLLAPLVYAARPAPLAKIIYSDGYVISESSYALIGYKRERSYLVFYLFGKDWSGEYQEMLLSNEQIRNIKDAQLSFVIESLPDQNDAVYDCRYNSSSYMRPLINRCTGFVKIRKLMPEEMDIMEAYKNEAAKTGKNVNVIFDKKLLVSKTFGMDSFTLHAPCAHESINIAADRKNYVSMNTVIEDHANKRFMVEAPAKKTERNCDNPPVDGLKVTFCAGLFKISEPPNAHRAVDSDRENRRIPLDALSEEELRRLLKDILDRMRF